jgi:hypothetical protein
MISRFAPLWRRSVTAVGSLIATGSPIHARAAPVPPADHAAAASNSASRALRAMSAGALPSNTIGSGVRTPAASARDRTCARYRSRCSSGSHAIWKGLLPSTRPPWSL